jgi:hypothetical protein
MTASKAAAGRSSTAHSRKLCVPPPLSPVTPTRARSTSGSEQRKSSARIEFQSWRPRNDCPARTAAWSVKPSPCCSAVDAAQARQLGAARLERPAVVALPARELHEAPARPVAVGREHRRARPRGRRHRAVQVAAHVVPGQAREEDLLDRVAVARHRAVDHRLQRGALRHGPEPGRHEHLPAQLQAARLPRAARRGGREGVEGVERPRRAGRRRARPLRGEEAEEERRAEHGADSSARPSDPARSCARAASGSRGRSPRA